MEIYSFLILFVLFIFLSAYFIRKNRSNLVQPHAFYTVEQAVLLLFIPFVQYYLTDMFPDKRGIGFLNSMIGLSYISFSVGFFTQKKKSVNILSSIVKGFNVSNPPKTILNLHILAMALVATALFIYLTNKSGMGLLPWLSNPRIGYQNHRTGLGHLYVASWAIWNFIFLYILFFKVKKVRHLIAATIAFVPIYYFHGSKGAVVFAVLESVVYYNFFINKIKLRWALVISGLFVVVFSFVFSLYSRQNINVSLGSNILRYADYYNNARMFFADFDDKFKHEYGKEYVNGLWMYVPRAFYPEKPYSYGVVKYVVEQYYPGAGESGHTPAFGGPVEEYLNFGCIGVILIGFMVGYFSSLLYQYFLEYRNFVGFVFLSNLMGFSIFPVIPGNLYKILWYVLNIVLLILHKQIMTNAASVSSRVNSKD